MRKVTTLFEYEAIDGLSSREMKLLSRASRIGNAEILKPVVKQGRVFFQARQYVGVVQLGMRTLQIMPKVYQSTERSRSIAEANRNLLWMLDYANNLKLGSNNIASLESSESWFEILIFFFATNLKRQWNRNPYRNYRTTHATLPVLKGKWRVAAQMKRPLQKHQFAVSYDEFTVDNQLNRIFRYVVEMLWRLTQSSQNRQQLSDLRYWMDKVTLLPTLDVRITEAIQLDRLSQDYEPLFNLAKLFLQRLGVNLTVSDITAFAFVFDMNQLFESFVTQFILRHQREILVEATDEYLLRPQSKQVSIHLAQRRDRKVFRLKPDLLAQGQSSTAVDFKYKRLDQNSHALGISEADFYQIYAYLNRFGCSQATLVYPQLVEMDGPICDRFSLNNQPGCIQVMTVNLLQDLTQKETRRKLILELRQIFEKGEI